MYHGSKNVYMDVNYQKTAQNSAKQALHKSINPEHNYIDSSVSKVDRMRSWGNKAPRQ